MKYLLLLLTLVFLSSCGVVTQAPEYNRKYKQDKDGLGNDAPPPSQIKPAIPKNEPKSRYGNPKSYTVYGKRYYVLNSAKGYKKTGGASWYGKKFHGERTSSGETYNMYAMSGAHKTLPLPSYVKVTNLDNRRHTIVRVNDRGPFHEGRIIDLSYSAARELGILAKGVGRVEVEAIDPKTWKKTPALATSKAMTHATIASPVASSRYYVQVGAFSDSNNAQNLATKLRSLFNKPVLVSKKKVNNKWLNVVKVGPLPSNTSSNIVLKQLHDHGYTKSRIIPLKVQ